MTEYLRYPIPALQEYVTRFFVQLGVPPADAAIAADVLVAADVRGVESHGVIRLNTYYGSRLRKGVMSPVTVISANPVAAKRSACRRDLTKAPESCAITRWRSRKPLLSRAKRPCV